MRLFLVPYVGEMSSDLAPAGGSMKATFFVIHIYTHSWMRNSDDSASFPIFVGKRGSIEPKGILKKILGHALRMQANRYTISRSL